MPTISTFLENQWSQLQGLLTRLMSQLGGGGKDMPKLFLACLMVLAVGTLLWVIFANVRIGIRARARARSAQRLGVVRYNPSSAIQELRSLTARRPQPEIPAPAEPDVQDRADFPLPAELEEHLVLPPDGIAEASPAAEIASSAEPENTAELAEQHHEVVPEAPAYNFLQADTNAGIQTDNPAASVEAQSEALPDDSADAPPKAESSSEVHLENPADLMALVRQMHDTILSQKATIEGLRGIIARHAAPPAADSSSVTSNGSGDVQGEGIEGNDAFEEQCTPAANESEPVAETAPT